MNITLYEIAEQYRAMVETLMDSDQDDQTIQDTIEAESYPIEIKAQNVAFAMRNMEATVAAIKDAEERMEKRRKAIENRVKRIREYLLTCMEHAGVSKIGCEYFELSIKSNPPTVDVYEPELLAVEYWRHPPPPPMQPDKEAIKAALKRGEKIQGVRMIQTKRLDVK